METIIKTTVLQFINADKLKDFKKVFNCNKKLVELLILCDNDITKIEFTTIVGFHLVDISNNLFEMFLNCCKSGYNIDLRLIAAQNVFSLILNNLILFKRISDSNMIELLQEVTKTVSQESVSKLLKYFIEGKLLNYYILFAFKQSIDVTKYQLLSEVSIYMTMFSPKLSIPSWIKKSSKCELNETEEQMEISLITDFEGDINTIKEIHFKNISNLKDEDVKTLFLYSLKISTEEELCLDNFIMTSKYGPINIDQDLIDQKEHHCVKFGGCRMLLCDCYCNNEESCDESNEENTSSIIESWFKNHSECTFCLKNINCLENCLRIPMINGCWSEFLCSEQCLISRVEFIFKEDSDVNKICIKNSISSIISIIKTIGIFKR